MTKHETHDKLRQILIDNGNEEYGDIIIDEICTLFDYPLTDSECPYCNKILLPCKKGVCCRKCGYTELNN